MAYKFTASILLGMGMLLSPCFAQEINKNDFIEQENERLREIKLLDLDLQRSSLKLKQKEILTKMAQLNHVPADDQQHTAEHLVLKGIIEQGEIRQAIVQDNGKTSTLKKGDAILGQQIIRIEKNKVVFKDALGQEKEILLGG